MIAPNFPVLILAMSHCTFFLFYASKPTHWQRFPNVQIPPNWYTCCHLTMLLVYLFISATAQRILPEIKLYFYWSIQSHGGQISFSSVPISFLFCLLPPFLPPFALLLSLHICSPENPMVTRKVSQKGSGKCGQRREKKQEQRKKKFGLHETKQTNRNIILFLVISSRLLQI